MIVITNSGPLIALAKLGMLNLLSQLYGKVDMPEEVYDEVGYAAANKAILILSL